MTQLNLVRFFISATAFLLVCSAATWAIHPQSLINFIGPAAAVSSALLLIWGASTLLAVMLISPLVMFFLEVFYGFEPSLAIMLIAIQAIILQALWTKQLVIQFIKEKSWLGSRKKLFGFLLRIGPLASLASASSVIIITMLDNQVINGSFLYAFVNTWSASMLVSVFFIPLVLLLQNQEKFKLSKRLSVVSTSLIGGLAIFLVLKTSQFQQQSYREALFEQASEEIERAIADEVATVEQNINSLSAFFVADRTVSFEEFSLFSESIYDEDSSVKALEWAPIIHDQVRAQFERQQSDDLARSYEIKERNREGNLQAAGIRERYAPLYFIYPQQGNEAALGLDVFTNPRHVLSMKTVIERQGVVASAPISLIQDNLASPGILFSRAIFSKQAKTSFFQTKPKIHMPDRKDTHLAGFVVAVAQFESFFRQLAKDNVEQVNFIIRDVSNREPRLLFGKPLPKVNRHAKTVYIDVYSRVWQLELAESSSWFAQTKSWQAWAVLLGGTLGAVLFQMLVLMMAAYSSELSAQVETKTRALIIAKEESERKNSAKSQFLQTLNAELRMPLIAIKSFVEQLKKKGIYSQEVTGVSHAVGNVSQLLDTMMDLTDIESGKIMAKQDCFDFYGFLQRAESLVKASRNYEGKDIVFLIDESVPHYINSDELYINKLINSLIESAHQLLNTEELRFSVKLHRHKSAEASLFFTLSSQRNTIPDTAGILKHSETEQENPNESTCMAMAIKYSQLLKGDTYMGTLSSGAGVLSASIRVTVSSAEEQEAQQGLTFDLI